MDYKNTTKIKLEVQEKSLKIVVFQQTISINISSKIQSKIAVGGTDIQKKQKTGVCCTCGKSLDCLDFEYDPVVEVDGGDKI